MSQPSNQHPRRAMVEPEDSVPLWDEPHEYHPRYQDTGAGRERTAASTRGSHAEAADHPSQTKAILATVGNTILPGAGLIRTKAGWFGGIILVIFLFAIGTLGYFGVTAPSKLFELAMRPTLLRVAGGVAILAGLVWVITIAGTYLVRRPRNTSLGQRGLGAFVVLLMSLLISVPAGVGAAYAFESANTIEAIFAQGDRSETRPSDADWAGLERVNILLVGGDSGEGRSDSLGVRADTIIVASIDTNTGNTVLIQVPRNMARAQFPAGSELAGRYPQGFYDGRNSSNAEYLINAVWRNVPAENPDLFQNTDYAGADAQKLAVSGTLGIPIHYFVMLNIDGLQQLIDAMGGVTVNINFAIAMGGSTESNCGELGYLDAGPDQHLNGAQAMWYARSRCNDPASDFGRMVRQTCLINAIIDQADPMTMVTRYEAIVRSAEGMVETDIPQTLLSAFANLALRVKDANVLRVAFIHGQDGFSSSNPDFDLMRARVQAAIEASEVVATPEPTAAGSDPATGAPVDPTTAAPTTAEPTATDSVAEAEVLSDACAYNPS